MSQAAKDFAVGIRPAVSGQSDKFSWRMYKRALKRGRESVYIMAWDQVTGDPFVPSLDALKAGDAKQRANLMLGYLDDGWFHGSRIQRVTREGASLSDFAYGPSFNTASWLDVTEWFWREYLERGRCIIHGEMTHEWVVINANARKCIHCGRHERRTVATVRRVKRVEVWLSEMEAA
jgi:hypothetical protein